MTVSLTWLLRSAAARPLRNHGSIGALERSRQGAVGREDRQVAAWLRTGQPFAAMRLSCKALKPKPTA